MFETLGFADFNKSFYDVLSQLIKRRRNSYLEIIKTEISTSNELKDFV
jgi:predicted CopG family antitoxin